MSPRTPRDDAFGADDLRPLTELPAADRAALCGLAFDIDDTVTAHGKLQPEAFDAMWRLHRAGVRLVAVTGRPLGWAAVVARQWPVDVAVGENGAGWFAGSVGRPAGSPAQGFFDGEEDRAEQRTLLASILAQVRATLPHVPLANDQGGRLCDLAFDVGEEAQLGAEDRAALVALIERAGARAVVSSVHAHAVPGDWNKAVGVVRAVAHILGEVAEELEELTQDFAPRGPGETPAEFARRMVGSAAAVYAHNDPVMSACNIARGTDAEIREILDRYNEAVIDQIVPIVEAEIAGGNADPITADVRGLVRTLSGVTAMTLSGETMFIGPDRDLARAVDVLEKLWLHALWGSRVGD